MEHEFTPIIVKILKKHFGKDAMDLFEKSPLLQYLNLKTVSATRGSKARSSFANLYAVYVLVEDYIKHSYHKKRGYTKYEGAKFSVLFKRQRELPFGSKLQNHALNHRIRNGIGLTKNSLSRQSVAANSILRRQSSTLSMRTSQPNRHHSPGSFGHASK